MNLCRNLAARHLVGNCTVTTQAMTRYPIIVTMKEIRWHRYTISLLASSTKKYIHHKVTIQASVLLTVQTIDGMRFLLLDKFRHISG